MHLLSVIRAQMFWKTSSKNFRATSTRPSVKARGIPVASVKQVMRLHTVVIERLVLKRRKMCVQARWPKSRIGKGDKRQRTPSPTERQPTPKPEVSNPDRLKPVRNIKWNSLSQLQERRLQNDENCDFWHPTLFVVHPNKTMQIGWNVFRLYR